jgi:PKD repeat protein
MAEEKPDGVKSVVSGWIKTLMTSLFGLMTGAVIMYLTPLVNSAIKPAKPVANFASQIDGLTVNFNNRSTGGVHGWWDFGDGTALEPFDPKVDVVKHTYAKPDSYKRSLRGCQARQHDHGRAGDHLV